ncbi:hypothetical protein [Streptomyces sp. NBC_00344]|uniref:hypothetical protein n=1 Tax=Streptomyces sp. NBC_00344 TaxID=2975720 RepID=UPI002E1E286E
MNPDDSRSAFEGTYSPLRDVAQNSEAFARYMADFQRVLLDMQANLEILQRETRVHCRGKRVEGDLWGQAKLRALPVERSLNGLLRHINSLTSGLEKSAHKRHAHDDTIKEVVKNRKEKALAKAQKKNQAALKPAPQSPQGSDTGRNPGYGGPASIYDLGKRSA